MKLEEKIISWSDGKGNTKFVARGGEILRFIGSELLCVKFEKSDEGNWTAGNPIPVFVISIGDYEPLTQTYKMVYKEKESDPKELRITPNGFSWNNPEEDGWMTRFVSYSQHFMIMEEELYYQRLTDLFNSGKGVLEPSLVAQFASGKERKFRLSELNYISVVINTNIPGGLGVGTLAFRVSEVTKVDKRGKKWEIILKDDFGDLFTISKYIQDESGQWIAPGVTINGVLLGDLKLIDIES